MNYLGYNQNAGMFRNPQDSVMIPQMNPQVNPNFGNANPFGGYRVPAQNMVRVNPVGALPQYSQVNYAPTIPPFKTQTSYSLMNNVYSDNIKNFVSVSNDQVDKNVYLFGYPQNSLRFGDLDYYNNYVSAPNTKNFTEKSMNTAMNSNVNPSMIENFSDNYFPYDLKLGVEENPNNHFRVVNSPSDTVTAIKFSKTQPDMFAISSWDGTVQVFKFSSITRNCISVCTAKVNGCVLDLEWKSDSKLIMGHSDGNVSLLDIQQQTAEVVGMHNGPVKSVASCEDGGVSLALSGSYDGTIKIWDTRTKTYASGLNCEGKIYGMKYKNLNFAFINNAGYLYVFTLDNPPVIKIQRQLESTTPLRSLAFDTLINTQPYEFLCGVSTATGKVYIISLSPRMKFVILIKAIFHLNLIDIILRKLKILKSLIPYLCILIRFTIWFSTRF